MIIGIPNGLLSYKYYIFFSTFFQELGADIVNSGNTDTKILNEGIKYCVDEACLPIKVFHGHIYYLRDKCDFIFIPRIMQLEEREFICPKFCGLPEMIKNDIPDLPPIITGSLYAYDYKKLFKFAQDISEVITKNKRKIKEAMLIALEKQKTFKTGIFQQEYTLKIGLIGHPYNIYDSFVNMNIIQKLNVLEAGVITEENVHSTFKNNYVQELFKRPFWNFAKNSYGAAAYFAHEKKVHGLIYISSFACGIDSVVLELIKNSIGEFPLLVIKIDEHTGEAGVNTRLEAFIDMLERRKHYEGNLSTLG